MAQQQAKTASINSSIPSLFTFAAFFVMALCCLLSINAYAQPPQKASVQEAASAIQLDPIHNLIVQHVTAIKHRRAADAYQLISNKGQERYGTAKTYWKDMRDNMRLLFNHTSYSFLGRNQIGNAYIQKLSMIDKSGKSMLVIFRVSQDSHQQWRIESVVIAGTSDSIA